MWRGAAGSATHHSIQTSWGPADGGTLGGVAIAEAVPTHHQLIHGVIILLLDLESRIQQVVAQRVEPGEVHPQVGDLQQVCKGSVPVLDQDRLLTRPYLISDWLLNGCVKFVCYIGVITGLWGVSTLDPANDLLWMVGL